MKKFFCYGKKGYCDNDGHCDGCGFVDNSGGEYREVPITNGDRIRAMSDEELAEFISGIADMGETLYRLPFTHMFCNNCPKPEYVLDDGRKMKLHECDFKDGKCPHGSDIVWWLQQPAEDDHETG